MQPTPRFRVLSDRIPRVLVFVYFYRGLSRNMEKSHGNELEAERARGQGAHPRASANQAPPRGLCSNDLRDQGKPCD